MAIASDSQQTLLLVSTCIIIGVILTLVYTLYCVIRLCVTKNQQQLVHDPRYTILPAVLLACSLSAFFVVLPQVVDSSLNRVVVNTASGATVLPPPSQAAIELHSSLWIADSHADTLLWPNRNWMQKSSWGHIDLPRLFEGNVALQVFSIVTGSPRGLNFERNAAPSIASDTITLKVLAERWGWQSISSRLQRCLFQCNRLHQIQRETNGTLTVITSSSALREYITHRAAHAIVERSMRRMRDDLLPLIQRGEMTATEAMNKLKTTHAAHGLHESFGGQMVAGVLAIEGLHALDDDEHNLDVLFRAGVRMMALSHFFDNALGGSSAGMNKSGITPMGARVIKRMNDLGIIIDVAHGSEQLIDDILAITTRPVIVSHTGVRAICNNVRNLGDDHIRAIASAGGIIGIAFFQPAICGSDDLQSIVASIRHVTDMVGINHVGLGSDYDGTVITSFDTSQLVHVTSSLLAAGYNQTEVAMIMGGNLRDFLLAQLPLTD